jgi:DNA-binding transcriptional regulator YhcF (GntR family)
LDKQILQNLYQSGDIKKGEKLVSNKTICNTTKQKAYIREFNKELKAKGIIEFKEGVGYFAKMDYTEAIRTI